MLKYNKKYMYMHHTFGINISSLLYLLTKHVSQKPIYKKLHVAESTSWEDLQFYNRRGSRNFSKGGWGGKFWKKNVCWNTYQRVYTWKLDKHATLPLFPFQEDCFLFFVLFFYTPFPFKFERGGATLVTPPPLLDPPMYNIVYYYLANHIKCWSYF